MASTTYPNFGAETEGIEVTKAFASVVRGKTILITGVAPKSLGQSAAVALVRSPRLCINTRHLLTYEPGTPSPCSLHLRRPHH